MALSLLERLQQRIHGVPSWPPPELSEWWDRVQDYRRRYDADRADLIRYAVDLNRTANGRSIFTPAPIAREMGSFSAAMLFSGEPQLTYDDDQDLLDEIVAGNAVFARFHSAATRIAIEGRGALRVHMDESVSDVPQIHYIPEDMVIWDERHGDIVIGGAVIIERKPEPQRDLVYRLVEEHEVGHITRTLYEGAASRLGSPVSLDKVVEFADLEENVDTGLDEPTLYRWNNKPGGESDLAGLEALLDRYDEGWSILFDKLRKSTPVSFADSELFDDNGRADLGGIIPLRRGNLSRAMGDEPKNMVETVQPELQAAETIAVLDRMRQEIFMDAGYSLSSYGLDVNGTADSGTALRLKQTRTIQTANAKAWEATEAMKNALACAMCWQDGGSKVKDYRPEVKLADPMPRDEQEEAQVAALWSSQEAISLEEMIRTRRPEWNDKAVEEEAKRIRADTQPPTPTQPAINLNGFGAPETNGAESG